MCLLPITAISRLHACIDQPVRVQSLHQIIDAYRTQIHRQTATALCTTDNLDKTGLFQFFAILYTN